MWQHNYEPVAASLGASALAAAIPIVVLFILLGPLRRQAWQAAMASLVSALVSTTAPPVTYMLLPTALVGSVQRTWNVPVPSPPTGYVPGAGSDGARVISEQN